MQTLANRLLYAGVGVLLALLGMAVDVRAQAPPQDSVDVEIGQMIMIGLPGATVDPATLSLIEWGRVGGILFFEKNLPPQNTYLALKRVISTYQQASPIPLIVAIDQEGGKVNRLKARYGFPETISAALMGQSLDSTRFYAEAIAGTLSGLGFNLNLAPVVDVAVDLQHSFIAMAQRSFSSSSDSVIRCAQAFIDAHHRAGVATTLKHFPGHGSALGDTHLGLTDVTRSWSADELSPYKALLADRVVDAIMTAHIVNRKLDASGMPATLSKRMIDSLLRKKMGYDGLVISDDMQMHAITKHYGFEASICYAIEAGVDILLFSNNISGNAEYTADKVHAVIAGLVRSGVISKERIHASFVRITRLKRAMAGLGHGWTSP